MSVILHDRLPTALAAAPRLPGVAPLDPDDWLQVDAAYAPQMAYRTALLAQNSNAVLAENREDPDPAREALDHALGQLPRLGFRLADGIVQCPDGRHVPVDWDRPLYTLGHLVQEDICILQRQSDEHVMTAAVVCFPANWRLADKIGKSLVTIHAPVPAYDTDIARRVQRLFDGVQTGRPLWRFNRLPYHNPDLHQPYKQDAEGAPYYLRSERQCILRLPASDAVIFTIHTYVVAHQP